MEPDNPLAGRSTSGGSGASPHKFNTFRTRAFQVSTTILPNNTRVADASGGYSYRFKNNCFVVIMRSGSEEGSYSRLEDFCIAQL